MSEAEASLLCAACGRSIALTALTAGRCPHCGAVHGLGADDVALAEGIFQTRAAVEVERTIWSDEMTRRVSKFSRYFWAAHPVGFIAERFTGGGKVQRDQHYLASLAYDGTYLDMSAPIRAERAALERARVDAEIAHWFARVRRIGIPVFTRTHLAANPRLWMLPLIGAMMVFATVGDIEHRWLSTIGGLCVYAYLGLILFDRVREHVRRIANTQAPVLAGSVDPRLCPQPLGTARMIAEWLAYRWAAPLGVEDTKALAGVSFTTHSAEGILLRVRDPDGAPHLVAHVPFVCTATPTSIQRGRADALLAELAARGWRIAVDDKIGARAVLTPSRGEFQPSELAPVSDDLRRLCALPEALGGASSLVLVTQALARVDSVAVHEAMRRHHAQRGQA